MNCLKKPKRPLPSDRLLSLMNKYNIPEELGKAIGQEAVVIAQDLFAKWKTNFEKAHKNERIRSNRNPKPQN